MVKVSSCLLLLLLSKADSINYYDAACIGISFSLKYLPLTTVFFWL